MTSLPPAIMTMTAIPTLIALALAFSRTRIGRQGGGRAVTCHICCHHSCHHWRHLCPHSRDDGAKNGGRGDRRGHSPNIHGWEEVGHHDPIGVEQQKQKQKQNQQKWQQRHCLYACRQLRPCCHRCCLCVSRSSRDNSTGVAMAAAAAEQ